MPKFKKISVDITTSKEERLPSLGTEMGFDNTLCESYILSQTGTRFGVIVKPDDDFFAPYITIDKNMHPQRGGGNRPENYPDVNPSEWHLLAEVYLDGRRNPEATTIIYLPWHVRAEERLLDSSIAWDSDGKAVERLWHFQEVGLENFVKTLSMSESDLDTSSENVPVGEAASAATEKDLLKMMQNLKTDKSNQDLLTLKAGQISVALWKIQILNHGGLDPPADSGEPDDHLQTVNKDQPTDAGESSHFIQIKEKFNVKFTRKRHYYKILDEEAYARFIFNYRSAEQLMKMKLLQKERHTRRGIDNVVPYLRPLTFGEQVKPSEPTNLLGKPKESFAKARSISKLNDQGLIAQQIRNFSLKKPMYGLGSLSKPVGPPKFTKPEGLLHPETLVGGSEKGYDGMSASIGNFIHDTKDHVRKPVSDNACCGSEEIDGSVTTENLKTLSLRDPPNSEEGSRDNYKTRVSARPVTIDSEDARLRDELMVKAPTSVIFDSNVRSPKRLEAFNAEEEHFGKKSKACAQDDLGIMSMEEDQLPASMGVSAAPIYQSLQMTKRVYRSEDEDDTEGPNVKRSRRIECNVADTSMTSPKL